MQKQTLNTQPRKVLGRKVKSLRREGILPGNLYGKKVKSQAIKVKQADFEEVFGKTGETGLVELVIDGKKKPVLIHNVQLDPVIDTVLHVDFLQVDLKEKVAAQVPVELVGESLAEKEVKGTVVQYIDEIEVEALPTELPEKFELDLSSLKDVDEAIKVSDLGVDKRKIEVKNDPAQIIVKVEPLRKEEEVVPTAEEKVVEAEEVVPTEEVAEEEVEKAQTKESATPRKAPTKSGQQGGQKSQGGPHKTEKKTQ